MTRKANIRNKWFILFILNGSKIIIFIDLLPYMLIINLKQKNFFISYHNKRLNFIYFFFTFTNI